MKKALIMGITGGFGGHVAQALAAQGWSLRALMRNPDRLPECFSGVEVVAGDAACHADVQRAAQGVELIVYGISPANYDWDDKALPWLENTAKVAEAQALTIVFPGNVYVFDPADGPDFDEIAPQRPVTSKGRTRLAMEQRLQQAARDGARVIILRCGDFIGANAPSSWINHMLKPAGQGYALRMTGPANVLHTWAYLPDTAQTVARLVSVRDRLPAYSVFHFKGYQIDFHDLAAAVQRVSGKTVALKNFPWLFFQLVAPFSKLFRGLLEMRYLWQREVNMSEAKLRQVLPEPIPHTSLEEALVVSGLVRDAPRTVRS